VRHGARAVLGAAADPGRAVRGPGSLRKLGLVALGAAAVAGVASFLAPHAAAAAISGTGGTVAAAAVQAVARRAEPSVRSSRVNPNAGGASRRPRDERGWRRPVDRGGGGQPRTASQPVRLPAPPSFSQPVHPAGCHARSTAVLSPGKPLVSRVTGPALPARRPGG
jgi:hypothetical protein